MMISILGKKKRNYIFVFKFYNPFIIKVRIWQLPAFKEMFLSVVTDIKKKKNLHKNVQKHKKIKISCNLHICSVHLK